MPHALTPRNVLARALLLTTLLVGMSLLIGTSVQAQSSLAAAALSDIASTARPQGVWTLAPSRPGPEDAPDEVGGVPLSRRIKSSPAVASWYRYQGAADAGACPGSNCGPAAAAMAIGYAKGRTIPVEDIRAFVSKGSCRGTDYSDLYRTLTQWKVKHETITGMKALKEAVNERGHAVVVLAYMGSFRRAADYLKPASDPAQRFDRYHAYTSGHVLVVRGFTKDGLWVIVEDPYVFDGSGWGFYKGGAPKGMDRYYRYAEFVEAYGYFGYQGVEIIPG